MKQISAKKIAVGALIAALYASLTLVCAAFGLAIGPFELRLSEALTVLPVFTPWAIPGLFCGCLTANLLCGAATADIVFGSLATLLGAVGSYVFRSVPLLPYLCPVLANTLIIPPILYLVYGFQSMGFWFLLFSFFVGEALTAGVGGWMLRNSLNPFQKYFK